MNKQDLICDICKVVPDVSPARIKRAVNEMARLITTYVAGGQHVTISGFGTFSLKTMRRRKARNPRTGEEVVVAACRKPSFRPSPKFKNMVTDDAEQMS